MLLIPTQMRSSYQRQVLKQEEKLSSQDAFDPVLKQIRGLYLLIKSRPDGINRYESQKSTGWGNGTYERIYSLCRQLHPDIKYDRVRHISIIESKIRKLEEALTVWQNN